MKLGLGLYRQSLDDATMRFARQCGCTHIVAHLTNYFANRDLAISSGDDGGWGSCEGDPLWSQDELDGLVVLARKHGLEIAALENFNPAHWYDVLLDGPKRASQIEDLKQLIRRIGKAGIPVMGYNFSIAGVWGWTRGPYARAGAQSVGLDIGEFDPDRPIPNGMVWNMTYDRNAPPGNVPAISADELWQRIERFLADMLPVAEEEGVALACHPDDPPLENLRLAARGINSPAAYERLIALDPSPANRIELCLGSIQEMASADVYEVARKWLAEDRIGYIHFRNVRGRVPCYREVFVDEGDIDMVRMMRLLHDGGYDGVLIPDHTPALDCSAPWHAGMAFALGYMRACIQAVERL